MILSNRKLRLIIIALLLFIFTTFLGMLSPKANSYTYDMDLPTINAPSGQGTRTIVVQPRDTTIFSGYKNGYILYSFQIGGNWETYNVIALGSEGQSSVCEVGTSVTYSDNTTQRTLYTVNCYMDFISGHFYQLRISGYSNGTTYFNYQNKISYIVNEDPNVVQAIRDLQTSILNSNSYDYNIKNNTNDIKNNTNDIKNTLNDSSIDTNQTSSDTSSWANMNASNGTITNLLTLPITLLQAIVNGLQSSCSSFSLGTLFNTNIVLPCINIGNLIGSGLWTTIDILFSGFMILAIAKKLIKIFNDFTNLKTNQMDEIYGGGSK